MKIKKDHYMKLIDTCIDLFMRPGLKDKQKLDVKEAMQAVRIWYVMKVIAVKHAVRWIMFLFVMYLIACWFLAYSMYI